MERNPLILTHTYHVWCDECYGIEDIQGSVSKKEAMRLARTCVKKIDGKWICGNCQTKKKFFANPQDGARRGQGGAL